MDSSFEDIFYLKQNYRLSSLLMPRAKDALSGDRLILKAERSPDIAAFVTSVNEGNICLRIVNDKINEYYKLPIPYATVNIEVYFNSKQAKVAWDGNLNRPAISYPESSTKNEMNMEQANQFLNELLTKMHRWGYKSSEKIAQSR